MALPKMTIQVFLRKYRLEWSDEWKAQKAVPASDTLIAEYDSPAKAYKKTQHLVKRDWTKGIVQDVWFSPVFEHKIEQLKLF
jgi:hypothetical protein